MGNWLQDAAVAGKEDHFSSRVAIDVRPFSTMHSSNLQEQIIENLITMHQDDNHNPDSEMKEKFDLCFKLPKVNTHKEAINNNNIDSVTTTVKNYELNEVLQATISNNNSNKRT